MFSIERYNKIIEILETKTSATVHYLATQLHVSEPTIRRDLSKLAETKKIKRTFGGAVINFDINAEVPLALREEDNKQLKEMIALEAVKYIKDDCVIFLDASSTVSYIIPHLQKFKNLTVITNSPKNSLKLAELKIKSFSTGGILLENSVAYVGTAAQNFIKRFNADLFLFSCRGISHEGMLSDSSIEETNLRQVMMRHAKKNVFLCTSDKLGKVFMYNLCHYTSIDNVISDIEFVFDK